MKKVTMLLLIAVLAVGTVFANGSKEDAGNGIAGKIAKGQNLSEA